MKRIVIAADPDMHTLPICFFDCVTNQPVHLEVLRVSEKITERAALVKMIERLNWFSRDKLPSIIHQLDHSMFLGVAVESQEIYMHGPNKTKNPRSLLMLANISGAILGALPYGSYKFLPAPQAWKGSVEKKVHQCRIFGRLSWPYHLSGGKDQYPVPDNPPLGASFNKSDWKHVVDAIGLAMWAKKEIDADLKEKELLGKA